MGSAKQKATGGCASALMSTAASVFLGNNTHPYWTVALYVAAAFSLLYALLQWTPVQHLLRFHVTDHLPLPTMNATGTVSGMGNEVNQLPNGGTNNGVQLGTNNGSVHNGDNFFTEVRDKTEWQKPRAEWLILSREFDNLPEGLRVNWSYSTSASKGVEAWGDIRNARCKVLCEQAALFLSKNPALIAHLFKKRVPSLCIPLTLWLECLAEVGGVEENEHHGRIANETGSFTAHLQGYMTELAQRSANLCRVCANWEMQNET